MEVEDKDLVVATLEGDKSSFEGLVNKYQSRVRGYCYSILRDFHQSEDAAQMVFVKAYLRLDTFDLDKKFYSWLMAISYNHCIDIIRKSKKHKARSFDVSLSDGDSRTLHDLIADDTQKNIALYRDLLSKLLSQLSDLHQSLISLKFVSGHSYQEISEITGLTIDSVKSHLKRAKKQLVDGLEK